MGLTCFQETNLFIRTNEPNEKFLRPYLMFAYTKYSVCGSIISHKNVYCFIKLDTVNLPVLALSDLHNGFLARGFIDSVCRGGSRIPRRRGRQPSRVGGANI